jgi:hypothetical protein
MNNQDYEQKRRECWEEYKRQNLDGEVQWQLLSRYDVYCAAFDRAYALGKQEKDADTVIQGWVARDSNPHRLYVYYRKPIRLSDMWTALDESFEIDSNLLFPDLTWESEPEEVEIIIKRKKK